MKRYIICLILASFALSCTSKENIFNYNLHSSGNYYSIPTKGSINPYTYYLTCYEENDSAWIFYGNSNLNELIIFTYPEGLLYKRIKFERDGPQGIGGYRGVHVHNLDSIFVVSATYVDRFFLTDTSGVIKNKYQVSDVLNSGMHPCIKPLYNFISNVANVHNNQINLSCYYPYGDENNEALPNEILDFTYDLEKDSIVSYSLYPEFSFKTARNLSKFSRAYNDHEYIYSLDYSDNIFYKNQDGEYITKPNKSVKSDKRLNNTDPDNRYLPINIQMKHLAENPQYYSLIFDKYRNCYYRFFYLGTKVEDIDNVQKSWEYPEQFSIMILNDKLEIIGETIFPTKKYNPFMSFICKDGLFIALHIDNPLYDHDQLPFERIDLAKIEND